MPPAIAGIQASLCLLVLMMNSVVTVMNGAADWPGEAPIRGVLAP
jgi:hypothetical protein